MTLFAALASRPREKPSRGRDHRGYGPIEACAKPLALLALRVLARNRMVVASRHGGCPLLHTADQAMHRTPRALELISTTCTYAFLTYRTVALLYLNS